MAYTESVNSATRGDLATLTKADILKGFYLAGGTGLALHLGHRESIDLDFFREESFDENRYLTDIVSLGGFALDKKSEVRSRVAMAQPCSRSFTIPTLCLSQ